MCIINAIGNWINIFKKSRVLDELPKIVPTLNVLSEFGGQLNVHENRCLRIFVVNCYHHVKYHLYILIVNAMKLCTVDFFVIYCILIPGRSESKCCNIVLDSCGLNIESTL